MKLKLRMRLVVLMLLLALVVTGCGQEQTLTSVAGTVVDSQGQPVPNAGVIIGQVVTTTNDKGQFYVSNALSGQGEAIIFIKGHRPTIIPVNLGKEPQTVILEASFLKRTTREGKPTDFILLLDSVRNTDLRTAAEFRFALGSEVAEDAHSLTGIADLNEAAEYLTPDALASLCRILRTRNLVWINENLDEHIQVFNAESKRITNLRFKEVQRTDRDGERYKFRYLASVLNEYLNDDKTETRVPVVGHKKSKLYHAVDANHLPEPEFRVYFSSRAKAEAAGYRPDPLCFGAAARAAKSELDDTEARLAREVTAFMESRYRITYSGKDIQRIKKIAAPIIAVSERANLEFTFGILETPEYNAYALPGGYIFITRPLLDILESDSELAAVIAHESVHITHMHAVKNYNRQVAMVVAGVFLAVATGDVKSSFDFVDAIENIVSQGYSKGQEYEADRTGLRYMARAGYDADAMLVLLRKLKRLEENFGGGYRTYSRTHPPTERRIERVEEAMRKVDYYSFLARYLE